MFRRWPRQMIGSPAGHAGTFRGESQRKPRQLSTGLVGGTQVAGERRARVRGLEQQVPHRAFSPTRNDKGFGEGAKYGSPGLKPATFCCFTRPIRLRSRQAAEAPLFHGGARISGAGGKALTSGAKAHGFCVPFDAGLEGLLHPFALLTRPIRLRSGQAAEAPFFHEFGAVESHVSQKTRDPSTPLRASYGARIIKGRPFRVGCGCSVRSRPPKRNERNTL